MSHPKKTTTPAPSGNFRNSGIEQKHDMEILKLPISDIIYLIDHVRTMVVCF